MKRRQKIITAALGLSVLVSLFPFPFAPERARAVVPTYEQHPALTKALPTTEAQHLSQSLYEHAKSIALATLKKRLLDMMVDQIILWIQGGGKPKFVTNWNGFLRDAANIAAGDFIKDIGLGFLCEPFNFQIQIAFLPVKKFTEQIECTLDQIVGNIQNFYNDFRNGGWIAYTGSLEPQNNFFGTFILAVSERDKRITEAEQAAQNEALAGGGYTSVKDCKEIDGSNSADLDGDGKKGDVAATCTVTVPGKSIGEITSKALQAPIDYILSAVDLGDYSAAIAAAITNRLILEGVRGIQGLSTGNSPSGGAIPPGGGACAGLSGGALASCLNYQTTSGNSFTLAQSILSERVADSVGPRKDADTAYADSIQRLQIYQGDLQNLLNLFSGLSCVNKTTYVGNINAEILYASSTIAVISNDKALNQAAISQLNIFQNQINALQPDDWTAFTTLSNQMDASGVVDPAAALNLKLQAETDNQNIINRIATKLQAFNQNLASCKLGI